MTAWDEIESEGNGPEVMNRTGGGIPTAPPLFLHREPQREADE